MKLLHDGLAKWLFVLTVVCGFATHAATLPADWHYDQSFTVSAAGLTKLSLPMEALDAARPGLEDLRLYDDNGNEVPYLIERPVPSVKIVQTVKSFQVAMQTRTTVITIETGLAQPLETVTLETPAPDFLKSVRVEASADGRTWQILAQGLPVFRLPNGASRLQLNFSSGVWAWLRLTVDDQRSAAIPFTGARVHATVTESAPVEWTSSSISESHENPGETRLALNLGAANLNIASVQIETPEPLFSRSVTLAVPQVLEDSIREQTIGRGEIYRVAVEGQAASENLSVPLDQLVRSRELLVFIKNDNNPPLTIKAVRIERRPVYLVFLARQAGAYHLLTGNDHCTAPKYDLAALGMNLKSVALTPAKISGVGENPNYHRPEVLAGVADSSTALDVSEWKYRKPVKLTCSGAQQLELDPEVLSHAQPGFGDLRLVRDGRQVPYLLEHTSISRVIKPDVTMTNDVGKKNVTRWTLKLPQANLPLTQLHCSTPTTLFERELTLSELNPTDDPGAQTLRVVGRASWMQKPDGGRRELVLTFDRPVASATLVLTTDNGDNAPITLEDFQVFYPATRVLFKANADDTLFLYYGNARASSPRYDLSLVAGQLLAAEKSSATFSPQELLKKTSWLENQKPGTGGVLFWGVLAVVVVVLLVIISRLLPKASPPA